MRFWSPPRGPVDLNWFGPLLRFAARCRDAGQIWPVHHDEFRFVQRVIRTRRPTLHVYVHRETGGHLVLDDGGNPYRWVRTSTGDGVRFLPERTLTRPLWRSGIPHTARWTYDERPARAS